jgi:hypothetical protein
MSDEPDSTWLTLTWRIGQASVLAKLSELLFVEGGHAWDGTQRAAIRIPLIESEQELPRQRLARLKQLKWRTTDPAAAINDEVGNRRDGPAPPLRDDMAARRPLRDRR